MTELAPKSKPLETFSDKRTEPFQEHVANKPHFTEKAPEKHAEHAKPHVDKKPTDNSVDEDYTETIDGKETKLDNTHKHALYSITDTCQLLARTVNILSGSHTHDTKTAAIVDAQAAVNEANKVIASMGQMPIEPIASRH